MGMMASSSDPVDHQGPARRPRPDADSPRTETAMPAPTTSAIVVVDSSWLLDESPAGRAGAATLQARYEAEKARYEKLRDKGTTTQGRQKAEEAAAAFEREAFAGLEAERAALSRQVLDGARAAIDAIMKERGGVVVVDARAAVAFDPTVDITDLVLARLEG
jgi:Skp family chaperone for outer membrane proteins